LASAGLAASVAAGFLAASLPVAAPLAAGVAGAAIGLVEAGAGLAEVKVRPLAFGEVGCGPLAFSTPAEGPAKRRPLLSGSFGGVATMGRLLPKVIVAGSGARDFAPDIAAPVAEAPPLEASEAAAGAVAVSSAAGATCPGVLARLPSGERDFPARLRGGVLPDFCGDLSVFSVISSADRTGPDNVQLFVGLGASAGLFGRSPKAPMDRYAAAVVNGALIRSLSKT
jgi:hypothetical protein